MMGDRWPRPVPVTRRAALAVAGAVLLPRLASAATLPEARSLASALAAALLRHEPLVVMASTPGCPFCRMVRDNYLAPLQRDHALPVVQLDLGSSNGIADFDGSAATHEQVLRRWRVEVAPTVLFFGRGGREAAPRLVGASRDFYAAYLDERLATARRQLG